MNTKTFVNFVQSNPRLSYTLLIKHASLPFMNNLFHMFYLLHVYVAKIMLHMTPHYLQTNLYKKQSVSYCQAQPQSKPI